MIPNSICSLFSEDFWNAISLNMVIAVVSALLLMFTIGILSLFMEDGPSQGIAFCTFMCLFSLLLGVVGC